MEVTFRLAFYTQKSCSLCLVMLRARKLLSYIYVDQVTNVPCSFFPQSAVDDNGYVPLVDAKDRLHHKHDPKTPPRMCLRLRGGQREVLNSTQNSRRSQLYYY